LFALTEMKGSPWTCKAFDITCSRSACACFRGSRVAVPRACVPKSGPFPRV